MAAVASASFPIAHLLAEMEAQHALQQSVPPQHLPSSSPPPSTAASFPAHRFPGITESNQKQLNANMARRASFQLRQQFVREMDEEIQRSASSSS